MAELRTQLTGPGSAFEVTELDVRGHRMPVFRHRVRNAYELLDDVRLFREPSVSWSKAIWSFRSTNFGP